MHIKIILSTFFTIFFAELGDKTQLAALAAAAGSKSQFSVFIGAATALVLSTLLAVALGSFLPKVFPLHYIKAVAGLLFIIFGIIYIKDAFSPPAVKVSASGTGIFLKPLLFAARGYEELQEQKYRKLAETAGDQKMKNFLLALADEEKSHIRHLHEIETCSNESICINSDCLSSVPELPGTRAAAERKKILDQAAREEKKLSDFYSELAHQASLPAVKTIFFHLAEEELSHYKKLLSFV
ncbi:MAG: hypothetical protein A2096_13400 [Spirochaetes bacterium GWF1_41_5]|nr:MAG: hypothetical protein A2096_13400 [Spirochaetes bacterium GWF1_41_5]HBE01684.1 hypothetical protein [Spirochaetia bacterium]